MLWLLSVCVCVFAQFVCVCVLIEFCVCVCPLVFLLLYDLCNHAFLYSHAPYMYITCMCVYACNMYMYTCVRIYCISNEFCIFCFVCCSQCQHSLDSVTALHTNTPSSTAYACVCTVFTIYSCTLLHILW